MKINISNLVLCDLLTYLFELLISFLEKKRKEFKQLTFFNFFPSLDELELFFQLTLQISCLIDHLKNIRKNWSQAAEKVDLMTFYNNRTKLFKTNYFVFHWSFKIVRRRKLNILNMHWDGNLISRLPKVLPFLWDKLLFL